MTDWKKKFAGETLIAHISDLHFGTANHDHCWTPLKNLLANELQPKLVLLTGDVVHTPDAKLYESAKKELDELKLPYYVCPGNHDRHLVGNTGKILRKLNRWLSREDTDALFDKKFGDQVLRHTKVRTEVLDGKWKLGLLGVDSSEDADNFARGYIDPKIFSQIEHATDPSKAKPEDLRDWDLVILLVHHHLQSVRKLEESRQQKFSDLANVTCLVNSGSFLECLTRAHIDVALHGHEHATHWSRYGSLEAERGEVHVLGAGSGTGNNSVGGCSLDYATFNLISLSPRRSARLFVVRFDSGSWQIKEEVPLFTSSGGRRLALVRRAVGIEGELDAQITKHVEFTRDRDILVDWVFTNWLLGTSDFDHRVENSTGRPIDPCLVITERSGAKVSPTLSAERDATKDYTWRIRGSLDKSLTQGPVRMNFSFKWRGGGLLTAEEIEIVRKGAAPGLLRAEGYEFASVFAYGALAVAQLVLTLPSEFAPKDGVEVKVFDHSMRPQPEEAQELKSRLISLGQGRYSLTVPYPRENWLYALAWHPPSSAALGPEEAFRSFARQNGDELLSRFRDALPLPLKSAVRLSLYVKADERTIADRVGHLEPEGAAVTGSTPAVTLQPRGDVSAIGQAFWGVPARATRPPAKDIALQIGFLDDEEALVVLPVRFGFDWINPIPWGVIRIGTCSAVARDLLSLQETLEPIAFPAMISMLSHAMNGSMITL